MARWTANANRATNVPYDVIYPGGTNTVIVDQTTQGGQWVLLMTTNFNAGTNGHVRIRNAGTSGYVIADAVEFIPYQETVAILATDPDATRSNQSPGSATIYRTGATDASLAVGLNFTGTAVNGFDYQSIPGSVVLPAGVAFTNIMVVPKTNNSIGDKTVVIGIGASANYTVGSLASATVTIHDTPINEWRVQYFGANATNSAIAGDNACPANDGVPNIIKYALGLNPNTIAVHLPLISFGTDTNGLFSLTYRRPDPPPADLNYIVEVSDELLVVKNFSNAPCLSGPSVVFNTNGTATITVESETPPMSAPKQFLRLRVAQK